MNILRSLSFAVLAPVTFGALALVACSSDDPNGGGSSSGTSGTSGTSGGTSGTSGTSGGTSGSSGSSGTDRALWYIGQTLSKVGATDLKGTATFEEDVTEGTPEGLTTGGGSAWVFTDNGTVLRYDLAAPKRVAAILTGAKKPSAIVYSGGSVWLADDDDGSPCGSGVDEGPAKLLRIDPATNTVVARKSITAREDTSACNRFAGLAADATSVYALIDNSFGAVRIDSATFDIKTRLPLGEGAGYGAGHVTMSADTLWVLNSPGHFLFAIDPATLTVRSKTPISDQVSGQYMVATKDAVLVDGSDAQVFRVDAKDPTKQEEKVFPEEPDTLVADGEVFYEMASPQVGAEILTLDSATVGEKSRTELPPLYTVQRFAFAK